ncbi:hypothetical protein F7725_017170 [Dissostichus mawsoni]|uniref:HECT domain-containing protein n=1 Tax=Dissostichus mawsoni TaxID=36200 RepID=A0A7J5Z6V3_DISMA|nr:hypothetical protein F7725_017170 [Dissostichus mawsoni]
MFREELLERNYECPRLFLSIDMFDSEEETESSLISFFKMNNVNWAAPFKCRLRGSHLGRILPFCCVLFVFTCMLRIKFMSLRPGKKELGCSSQPRCQPTRFVNGHAETEDRLQYTFRGNGTSGSLRSCCASGKHHSFLHGGFGFSGLSVPVVTLLTGWSTDTAASALTLLDCPDLDHRETIGFVSVLLNNTQLTAQETTSVTDLCLSWDLPVPTSTNHDWLFQELLSHAVLHRVRQPIKQIRKGLKETGIWPLVSNRPDVHPILFPREKNDELNSQTVIQNIHWPQPKSDSDEDDAVPLEKVSLVTGFLRQFIEEASPKVQRDLLKFWVGWELLTTNLEVEVVTSTYPVALTCFLKLKLPSHYQTYEKFHQDLMMALSSISSGFGLV